MTHELQLCNDWNREFPCLARFKNGRKLLRIQTPVVFGIELEKFLSDKYRPKFIALNLLSQFPGFSINRGLRTAKGLQLSIAYSKQTDCFQEAVGLMKSTFPFLTDDGALSEQTLINIYRSESKAILAESASPLAVWFSLIQLLKFFQRDAEASSEEASLKAYVKTLNPASLAIYGDFDAFIEQELHLTPDKLAARGQANFVKGKWDTLPDTCT